MLICNATRSLSHTSARLSVMRSGMSHSRLYRSKRASEDIVNYVGLARLHEYNRDSEKYRNFKVGHLVDETLREGCERCGFEIDDGKKFKLLKSMTDAGLREFFIGIGPKKQNRFISKCLQEKLDTGVLPFDTKFIFITLLNSWKETLENLQELPKHHIKELEISFGMVDIQSKNQLFESVHNDFTNVGFKSFRISTLNNFSGGLSDEMYAKIANQILRCKKLGINTIRINDSVGTLYPEDTAKLCQSLTADFKNTNFCLHTHNDRGLSLVNSLVSIQNGFNMIEGSLAGFGNRSGITPIDLVVKICQEKNIDLGGLKIDKKKLKQTTQLAEQIFLAIPNVYRPDSGIFTSKVNIGALNIPDYLQAPGERNYVLNADGVYKGNIKSTLIKEGFDRALLEDDNFMDIVISQLDADLAHRSERAERQYSTITKEIFELQKGGGIEQKDILNIANHVRECRLNKYYPFADESYHWGS